MHRPRIVLLLLLLWALAQPFAAGAQTAANTAANTAATSEAKTGASTETAPTPEAAIAEQAPPAPKPRDYLAERRALAAKEGYDPYSLAMLEMSLLKEHVKRAKDEKYSVEEVNEPLKKLIDAYPLGILPNRAVAHYLRWAANNIEDHPPDQELLAIAAHYDAIAQGVLDSILGGGDGKSTATAWEVINQNEEYAVLDHLGLEAQDQALIFDDGKGYDRFKVKDKQGLERTVYFDVSLFFGAPMQKK